MGGVRSPLLPTLGRVLIFAVTFALGGTVVYGAPIENVSPVRSDNPGPNSSSGGRVHNLAVDPNNNQIIYAASEWGGLFKSTDGGDVWLHLDGHLPLATWDVAVSPANSSVIFASSLYDGRVEPETGIQVSRDGGDSWTQPETIEHPPGACTIGGRQGEVSGFGISINPANANNVIVGTNCGVAESTDGGNTWTYVPDPTLVFPGSNSFYDVVIHNGGIVDICGQEGFFRRPAPTPANPNPVFAAPGASPLFGECSIAVSPVDPQRVFLAGPTGIFESPDGGATWPFFYPSPEGVGQGRKINIATNNRGGNQFDLWFGDINLWRRTCQANPGGGGGANCNPPAPALPAAGWTNVAGGAHADAGSVAFSSAATNACPLAYANDGGVYVNTPTTPPLTSPACQTPTWAKPSVSPTALWVDDLDGIRRRDDERESLFIGLQDNGQFITETGSSTAVVGPAWTAPQIGDVPEVDANANFAVATLGFFGPPVNAATLAVILPPNGQAGATASANCWDVPDPTQPIGPGNPVAAADWRTFRLQIQTPTTPSTDGFVSGGFTNRQLPCQFHPPGLILRFRPMDTYARIPGLNNGLVAATSRGIFAATNVARTAPAPRWFRVGMNQPVNACNLQVAGGARNLTYFVRDNDACSALQIGQIFRLRVPDTALTPFAQRTPWAVVATDNPAVPPGTSSFGPYAVDPNDPDTIIAVDHTYNPARIVMTTNGGGNWRRLVNLERLMRANGDVKYVVAGAGARPFNADGSGYVQPSIFAFDPEYPNIIAAGGFNSGFFMSIDRGRIWRPLSDPTEVSWDRPNISHPLHVHFEHDEGVHNIYIGTRGRGVWRIPLGIRVSIGLDSLTVVNGLDDVDRPMVWATFSMRDASSPRASPTNPYLRIETRRLDSLGDLGNGDRVAIPRDFGEYRGPFIPFCGEGGDEYHGLPSRIIVAAQGWEHGSRTRQSDRATNFGNWSRAFDGRLRQDIERNSDDTDLAEIADRHWVTFRWGETDDFAGSDYVVFDREEILNLASRARRLRATPGHANFTFNFPSSGQTRYRVQGYINVTGFTACK
jgi:hypothetical protein